MGLGGGGVVRVNLKMVAGLFPLTALLYISVK